MLLIHFPLIFNTPQKRYFRKGFAYVWDHLGFFFVQGGWDYGWLVAPLPGCHSHGMPRPRDAPQPTPMPHWTVATPAMEEGRPPERQFQPGPGRCCEASLTPTGHIFTTGKKTTRL